MKSLSFAVFVLMAIAYANAGLIGAPLLAGPWGAGGLLAGPAGILTTHGGIIGTGGIAPAALVTAGAIPSTVIATHDATIVGASAAGVAITPLHPHFLGLGLHHAW